MIDPQLSSKSEDWYTHAEIIALVHELFPIDLDPMSCYEANKVVQAKGYYTKEDDGLLYPWEGRVLLNPPWGRQLGICGQGAGDPETARRVPLQGRA
jgi:hypothetical protein